MPGYLNAKLYFDLGIYLGNNYRSALQTLRKNVLKEYRETKYRESCRFDIEFQVQRGNSQHYCQTKKNVTEVIGEYYNYSNEFPNGKYIGAANRILKEAKNVLK